MDPIERKIRYFRAAFHVTPQFGNWVRTRARELRGQPFEVIVCWGRRRFREANCPQDDPHFAIERADGTVERSRWCEQPGRQSMDYAQYQTELERRVADTPSVMMSLAALEEWAIQGSRSFTVSHGNRGPKPWVVRLVLFPRSTECRGTTMADALAHAAGFVLLNPLLDAE